MNAAGSSGRWAAKLVKLLILTALAVGVPLAGAAAQDKGGGTFDCPTEPNATPPSQASARDYAALRAPTTKDDFCLKLDQGSRSRLELFGGAKPKPEDERSRSFSTDDARRRDVDGHFGLRLRLPLN